MGVFFRNLVKATYLLERQTFSLAKWAFKVYKIAVFRQLTRELVASSADFKKNGDNSMF